MAQMKRLGDDGSEKTGLHTPESLRKEKEKTPETSREHEESPEVKKAKRFIEFREMDKLKKYLQELGGDVTKVRGELKKRIGKINTYKNAWNTDELQAYVLDCINDGDSIGALEFVDQNEQYILEQWIDDYMVQKNYHQAADTLATYAKTHPSQRVDGDRMKLEEDVDREILGTVGEVLKKKSEYVPAHDRVWSLAHNGCYKQAAELCSQLNEQEYKGETLEESKKVSHKIIQPRDTDVSELSLHEGEEVTGVHPLPGEKTLVQPMEHEHEKTKVEGRHEAELLRALPETSAEMKKVFKDLPELISHFHHLSNIDNGQQFTGALQGIFELDVNRLFDQKKVVITEKNVTVPVQEELLGIVEDLGYLGFNLYINHRSDDNTLQLLQSHEADPDYYTPVDVTSLSPNDILIDEQNFIEEMPETLRMKEDEKTLTGEEPTVKREPLKFTWISKAFNIKPEKAHELRWAA